MVSFSMFLVDLFISFFYNINLAIFVFFFSFLKFSLNTF